MTHLFSLLYFYTHWKYLKTFKIFSVDIEMEQGEQMSESNIEILPLAVESLILVRKLNFPIKLTFLTFFSDHRLVMRNVSFSENFAYALNEWLHLLYVS